MKIKYQSNLSFVFSWSKLEDNYVYLLILIYDLTKEETDPISTEKKMLILKQSQCVPFKNTTFMTQITAHITITSGRVPI